jgi:diadenosine tetraphosphatase ApaH/serine/threonine PP2A family protein phosphatase
VIVALLSDIHANFEALSECLEHARARGAERFVFLGDYVGYGPDPERVLDVLANLVGGGGVAVLGNHDLAVTQRSSASMQEDARAAIDWTRKRLSNAQIEFLAGLPLTAEESGRLYVHANAWAPDRWEYITGVLDARRSMRTTRHRWTFCGHVHTPALYHMTDDGRTSVFAPQPGVRIPLPVTRRWLAVVGSVGQPRDGNPAASYALFDDTSGLVTFLRVPYDYTSVARRIRESGLPTGLAMRLEAGA